MTAKALIKSLREKINTQTENKTMSNYDRVQKHNLFLLELLL